MKTTLKIYLETDLKKVVTLKGLLLEQLQGKIPAELDVTISLAPNLAIELIDDLLDVPAQSTTFKNKLEFIIRENSRLTYSMRSVSAHDEHKNDSLTIEKELTFKLMGKNAHVDAVTSCFILGNRVYKFKTMQDHLFHDAVSNVTIKAVLDDQAKITCTGMIRVAKGAQQTNAYLLNKNILLSRQARAVSIPQLEIEADDVKCKHGAAVSRLDDEQMFYMKSRGIGDAQTRSLLIDAFLS